MKTSKRCDAGHMIDKTLPEGELKLVRKLEVNSLLHSYFCIILIARFIPQGSRGGIVCSVLTIIVSRLTPRDFILKFFCIMEH